MNVQTGRPSIFQDYGYYTKSRSEQALRDLEEQKKKEEDESQSSFNRQFDQQSQTATTTTSSPIASSATGSQAYGAGQGVFPVAQQATTMPEMASSMTGFTPAASSTAPSYGLGTGVYPAGTAAPAASGAGTGSAAGGSSSAGYGALGWWGALAALVAGQADSARKKGWYEPEDFFKGTAMAERWKNMDAGKNFSSEVNDLVPGLGGIFENSSRTLSIDPREQAKGSKGMTHDLIGASKSIAHQNFEGAKDFSNKTIVDPTVKSAKAIGNGVKGLAKGLKNIFDIF